jgi:2-C-methyl-D-erythritol 4-phosphate cytidylyltransferase
MNYGIILLGGDSLRTSTSLPKQYIVIGDKEVFLYPFELFLKNPNINKILLVVSREYVDFVEIKISQYKTDKEISVIEGGTTRQDSSFLALRFIKNNEQDLDNINIIIHDAARPLLTTKVLNNVINALTNNGAVTTYFPISDSLLSSQDQEYVDDYPSRKTIYAIQTPQAFRFNLIYQAHEEALNKKYENITDDSMLVKKLNKPVKMVLGDSFNFKITTYDDLMMLRKIIEG